MSKKDVLNKLDCMIGDFKSCIDCKLDTSGWTTDELKSYKMILKDKINKLIS